MDIKPTNQQPISDDQELAKVLAGINQQADEAATAPVQNIETTPVETAPTDAVDDTPAHNAAQPAAAAQATVAPAEVPADPVVPTVASPVVSGDLDSIKQTALGELRPLVDKLDVPAEEKFDTYLLLLRSTDDKDLIAPAHEAARAITDEARRAKALLDIIKEIDYLSGAPQQPAL